MGEGTWLPFVCRKCKQPESAWEHGYDRGICNGCGATFTELRGTTICPACYRANVIHCDYEPWLRLDVLDHGFVELVDIMGDDLEPATAARISYSDGIKRPIEAEMGLSKYLLENYHTTPFEMVELKFRMKMPIFVARQIVRHRTANINEFSMRYADPERLSDGDRIDYYVPKEWRSKDPKNKQGSVVNGTLGGVVDHFDKPLNELYSDAIEDAITAYHAMQQHGVANEMARMVLPVSVYTEWIWKNDFHNTLHFLQLRADAHAQWETQEYARAMITILEYKLPMLMQLWQSRRG